MSQEKSIRYRELIRNYGFRRIRAGRSKVKRLLKRWMPGKQVATIRSGLRMELDLGKNNQDMVFWFYEEVEPALQWAIRTFLPVGGNMVDCGANSGIMGLLAIHERQARTLFLEPLPRLCATIERGLELSGYQEQGCVHTCAASDSEAEATFYLHPRDDGSHSLVQRQAAETVTVQTRLLGNILDEEKLSLVDFIKVDTEGHDLAVLKGLGDWLTPERIPALFIEMGKEGAAINTLMRSCGYLPFQSVVVYIDGLRRVHRRQTDEMICWFTEVTDLKAVPFNALWVAGNSAHCRLLKRISDIGTRADRL